MFAVAQHESQSSDCADSKHRFAHRAMPRAKLTMPLVGNIISIAKITPNRYYEIAQAKPQLPNDVVEDRVIARPSTQRIDRRTTRSRRYGGDNLPREENVTV